MKRLSSIYLNDKKVIAKAIDCLTPEKEKMKKPKQMYIIILNAGEADLLYIVKHIGIIIIVETINKNWTSLTPNFAIN